MNKNLLTKLKKNKKGFTLIELIVVIAILGILAAIAIPRFSGFTETARISSDEQMANVVVNAALLYAANNNGALPTMANLHTLGFIEKEYTTSDLKSSKYTAGNEVFTIGAPGTGETGTVKVVIGGDNTYSVLK